MINSVLPPNSTHNTPFGYDSRLYSLAVARLSGIWVFPYGRVRGHRLDMCTTRSYSSPSILAPKCCQGAGLIFIEPVMTAGLFVYGYCFYYYLARSDMSGFMQTSFFFGTPTPCPTQFPPHSSSLIPTHSILISHYVTLVVVNPIH